MSVPIQMQKLTRTIAGLLIAALPIQGWGEEARVSPAVTPSANPTAAETKPKVVPAILIKRSKISTGDDPRLPEAVKAEHRCEIVTASYKVCIAESGQVATVETVNGLAGADAHIISVVKNWRFKPQPIPVCFIQFFEYHIDGGEVCLQPERAARWLDRRVEFLERGLASLHNANDALLRRLEQLEATCAAAAAKPELKGGPPAVPSAPEPAPGVPRK